MANRFPLIFNSGAGQIQELAASDNLDLTSSNLVNAGILFTSSGSATAPSLQIGSGTTYNPGLYSPGTDQLAISTNGTGRLFVDANGNIGVGVSPSAKLEVNGESRFTRSGVSSQYVGIIADATDTRIVAEGSSKNLTIKNNSTTSSAIFFDQAVASVYVFQQAGTERFRVRADGLFEIKGAGTAGSSPAFSVNQSAPTDSLFITSGGLMGLGTGSPGYRLTVKAANDDGIALTRPSSAAQFHLLISTTETGGDQYTTKFNTFNNDLILNTFASGGTGGTIRFRTGTAVNPTDKMVLDSSGRLGIGTTSPATDVLLTVGGTDTDCGIMLDRSSGNNCAIYNVGGNLTFKYGSSSTVGGLNTSATLDSSGRLLVGTSSYTLSTSKLEIAGTSNTNFVSIINTSASDADGNRYSKILFRGTQSGGEVSTLAFIGAYHDGSADDEKGMLTFNTNDGNDGDSPTEVMRITSSLEVLIGGTVDIGPYALQVKSTGVWGAGAYVNGSDRSIKEDIEPLTSSIEIVKQLNPVSFRYKEDFSKDTTLQPGFVAQDLQQAFAGQPYLDGIVQAGPEFLSVAYQSLIPILTKALQEAVTKIETLEAKVAALEAS